MDKYNLLMKIESLVSLFAKKEETKAQARKRLGITKAEQKRRIKTGR